MRGLICSAGSAASLAPSLHMTNIEKFQILVLPPLKQRLVCHQKDESGRARAGRRPPLSLSFSILLRPSLLLYISTTKPIRLVCSLSCLPSRISLSGARIRAGGRGGGGHSLDIEKSPRQRAEGGLCSMLLGAHLQSCALHLVHSFVPPLCLYHPHQALASNSSS